jgi:hypothetical protein
MVDGTHAALYLDATSLLSKWGFGDGDCLNDWWWDTYDEPFPEDIDFHDVLVHLVKRHLLPRIAEAGYVIDVMTIDTIHNPIRAETVNGRRIDHHSDHDDAEEALTGIYVNITAEQVNEAIEIVRSKGKQ